MKSALLCCLLLLTTVAFAQKPIVSSFLPASGYASTQVTINGSNFSSSIAGNTVFFGAVKATITAASATSLTVTVPTGATYQPITVTTNGLTGYSAAPFILTFPAGTTLQQKSFDRPKDFATDLYPFDITIADFDGDNKPDVATANYFNINGQPGSLSVLRNTGSTGLVTFAPVINLPTIGNSRSIASGDLDGDGKPDIVSGNLKDGAISVFQNTCTAGSISFAPKVDYGAGGSPSSIAISDIDGDGRPDIIVANSGNTIVSVYRNTSSTGSISFATNMDFTAGIALYAVATGDVDGDGKPDVVVTNEYENTVSVLRNISSPGSIGLSARQSFATGSTPHGVAVGDLNNDGKPDIAVANYGGNFSVLRNNSTTGTVSFAVKIDFAGPPNPHRIAISDVNGDAKPDLMVTGNGSPNYVLAAENTSTGSTPSFASTANLLISPNTTGIADFDGDGKPDIVGTIFGYSAINVLRNRNNEPTITSYSPNPAATGDTVTITGSSFTGITSVTFGGTNASYFTVINSTTIKAVVGNGASGDVVVIGQYGSGNSGFTTFVFAGPPVINSFTPTAAATGQTVTITGRNFYNVTSVSLGGITASFSVTSPAEIKATVGSAGSSGRIKVTTQYGVDSLAGFTYIPIPTITGFSPTYGGPGMAVTITGTNLLNATGINFGGTPARSFTVNSNTSITAIIDIGSTGTVAVTTPYGTASQTGFTFYPAPAITSFSPAGGSTGTVVTINGANFVSGMTVSVGGISYTNNYALISAAQIQLTLSSTTAADTANIVITSRGGTATTTGFLFNPKPYVSGVIPREAATGMTTRITGLKLTNVTSVTLGGVPVQSFTIDSATSITAVVGAGATGPVVVTNSFGTNSVINNEPSFIFVTIPVISSFLPQTGAANTRVTIKGGNFNASAAGNTVYFATTRAEVVSATPNMLTVLVPAGAAYAPISITSNGTTGYSSQPFNPTFVGGNGTIAATSFAKELSFKDGANVKSMKVADIDADGKPDLVINRVSVLSIYRNISTTGSIAFAPRVDIAIPNNITAFGIGDLDSDGRLDIAVATTDINNGIILRNNSSAGNISFAPVLTFSNYDNPFEIIITDLNKDGKPDIAIPHTGYAWAILYRNTTTGGTLSFAPRTQSSFGINGGQNYATEMTVADLNNDGLPEFVMNNILSNAMFALLKNVSVSTNMGFNNMDYRSQYYYDADAWSSVASADFNSDGKNDLLFTNFAFANTGTYTATGYQIFNLTQLQGLGQDMGERTGKIRIHDLDGDGKPDYTKFNYPNVGTITGIRAMRNTTTTSAITFAPSVTYNTNRVPYDMAVSDMDGDGKPDIIYCGDTDTAFYVLKNLTGAAQACLGGNTTFTAGITGSNYQWQVNTGSGFTNISDNGNYSGTSTSNLQLSGIAATWAGYQYRCVVGSSNSPTYIISFLNSWTGRVNNQWENPANWNCGVVPDANTDVVINGGSVVISSNVQVRTMKVQPQASVTVASGYTLTVMH